MYLGEIADIKTGLVLSRKKANTELEVKRRYRQISLNNIEDEGYFNEQPIEFFYSNDVLEAHYFTQKGDVLIRLSHPYTAIYIDQTHEQLLVPSYFAIVRLTHPQFIPEYIAWYLNTHIVKNELEKSQSGTRIPSTNKNVLKNLEVKQLPQEKQVIIADMHRLYQKERRLYQQLLLEKEKLYQSVAQHIIADDGEEIK